MHSVAFVVLAHHLPEQLERLLDALASPDTRFYVHIDRRSERTIRSEVRRRLRSRTDVRFLRSRRTKWGSFGHVLAALDGIKTARRDGAEAVMVRTGQDYPIKPIGELLRFLGEHRDQSFLEYVALPHPDWPAPGGLERLNARGFRVFGRDWLWKDSFDTPSGGQLYRRLNQKLISSLPHFKVDLSPMQAFTGSALFTLNGEACDYVIANLANNRRLRRLFRVVQLPDEMAIHTVLANSPLHASIVNDDLTFADWSAHGPHPEVLTPEHLVTLASSGAFFARKFDGRLHPSLLDAIDRDLRLD